MTSTPSKIDLQPFYPHETEIRRMVETNDRLEIHLKSHTRSQTCPTCHQSSQDYHSTYRRKLQDLPIFMKRVYVHLAAYRYYCHNEACSQKVFTESVNGFCGSYKRMTGRLEDFITTLALQTSCEGASRICSKLGIQVSGDTVIRILLNRAENNLSVKSEFVGVDDWAYRKRSTYGTIIVDGETHKTLDLLEGRDATTLKKWLKDNKQVKVVTRDRANAYASAIQEILPDAMQVADRFHLHQNLMEAIKKVLAQEIPDKIRMHVSRDDEQHQSNENEPLKEPISASIKDEASLKKNRKNRTH